MGGGNGVSLPPAMSGLSGLTGDLGFRFDGTFHNGLFQQVDATLCMIFIGLAIAWFQPNTYQLFAILRPALAPTDVVSNNKIPRLVWRPNWRWGCGLGFLFALAVLTIGGESPFLYFRF
jgi:hypothetical protein